MSDDTKPAASEAKASASESSSSSGSSSGEAGKSSRESVGGAKTGHYGFFSNIKTPEYKSGWDDIWGKKKKGSGGRKKAAASGKSAKNTPKKMPKQPVTVEIAFDDLPEEARAALAAAAGKALKASRISYDRRDKAGAVSWRIACEVKR